MRVRTWMIACCKLTFVHGLWIVWEDVVRCRPRWIWFWVGNSGPTNPISLLLRVSVRKMRGSVSPDLKPRRGLLLHQNKSLACALYTHGNLRSIKPQKPFAQSQCEKNARDMYQATQCMSIQVCRADQMIDCLSIYGVSLGTQVVFNCAHDCDLGMLARMSIV